MGRGQWLKNPRPTLGLAALLSCTRPTGAPASANTPTPTVAGVTADEGGNTSSGKAGGVASCGGRPSVQFVYFVEADARFSQEQYDAIESAALHFQAYWDSQLGATFLLADPLVAVVEGDHAGQWYVDTPDGIHDDPRWYRLGNIKAEVYDKLGFDDFDPLHRVVNHPTSRHDGRVGANFGGAWMDGDDLGCLYGEYGGVNFPFDEQGPAHCIGHVAHEFGHILGLEHSGPVTDCMQLGFYNGTGGDGMCSFSADNVAQILRHRGNAGWLDAEPGDRCVGVPEPQPASR